MSSDIEASNEGVGRAAALEDGTACRVLIYCDWKVPLKKY